MSEVPETPDVPPRVVGQERPTEAENKSGVGGYVKAQATMWIVVIAVLVVFIVAIVFVGVSN